MEAGSSIVGPGKSITVTVPDGDMTMEGGAPGALISTTVTNNGGAAGPITIHVGNYADLPGPTPAGVFVMETGSKVEANGGSSGAGGNIDITAGHHPDIDGEVRSEVNTGMSGGTGRDGGPTCVKTGCGLTVGETGVISSHGQDRARIWCIWSRVRS